MCTFDRACLVAQVRWFPSCNKIHFAKSPQRPKWAVNPTPEHSHIWFAPRHHRCLRASTTNNPSQWTSVTQEISRSTHTLLLNIQSITTMAGVDNVRVPQRSFRRYFFCNDGAMQPSTMMIYQRTIHKTGPLTKPQSTYLTPSSRPGRPPNIPMKTLTDPCLGMSPIVADLVVTRTLVRSFRTYERFIPLIWGIKNTLTRPVSVTHNVSPRSPPYLPILWAAADTHCNSGLKTRRGE